LPSETKLTTSAQMDNSYDVVIVGGGFAGITAARELRLHDFRCLMLEARDRLGGRTFCGEFGGRRVEFGGTWIHWSQPHVWAELTRYGLGVTESVYQSGLIWIAGGQRRSGTAAQAFGGLVHIMPALMREAQQIQRPYDQCWWHGLEALDAISVQTRIDESAAPVEQRELLEAVISTAGAAICREVGLLLGVHHFALANSSFSTYLDALGRFKVREGTRALVDAMIADARPEIRLSSPVARVEQDEKGVRVRTRAGEEFGARAAVVAVPVNVLNSIEFSPQLRRGKVAAARDRHSGHGLKCWMVLRGISSGTVCYRSGIGLTALLCEEQTADGVLAVGFGPDREALDITDRGEVERAVREFAPQAQVLAVGGHDWVTDEFSQGLWAAPRPGHLTRYLDDLQAAEGRLVFAGGDIASGWMATIDGAIESGLRSAREVLKLFS